MQPAFAQTPLSPAALSQLRSDSIDQVIDAALQPYQDRIDPCAVTASVEVYPVAFENSIQALISTDEPLTNVRIAEVGGYQDQTLVTNSTLQIASIVKGRNYQLKARDKCGNQVVVKDFASERLEEAPLRVSRASFEAIVEWQEIANERNVSLQDFLAPHTDIGLPEKLYVLQQTVNKGAPYPDEMERQLRRRDLTTIKIRPPIRPPFDPGDPSEPGDPRNNCRCTVIQVNIGPIVSPILGLSSNGQGGEDLVGIIGSNREEGFANDRIDVWTAHAIEGPSRYMELWADTDPNRCIAAPYRFGWNDAAHSDATTETEDIFPSYTAELTYNLLCINGDDLPDGECGCDREVRYEAAYNSVVRAQANFNSNWSLTCSKDHSAMASAEDFVMLAGGELSNDGSGEFEIIAMNANAQITECSMEWVGPTVADFISLGYYVFLYTKGIDPNTQIPVVDQGLELAYNNYLSSQAQDPITTIFGSNWREFTGVCGGDVVGRSSGLNGNSASVTGSFVIKPQTPYRLVLASGSRLRVGGQRRWDANARVHSSFRMTGLLRGQSNTGSEFEEHCCSPAAAVYMMSTISEDVAQTSGVSAFSWRQAISVFLNTWGVQHQPVGDYGEVVEPNFGDCETEINIASLRQSGEPSTSIESVIAINGQVGPSIPRAGNTEEVLRIISVSGQILYTDRLQEGDVVNLNLSNFPAGIYFASLQRSDGTSFTTKFVHTR